jgi:hypothetical protein
MTITIESTHRLVECQGGIQCRVWEGKTSTGIRVYALIPRIGVHNDDDHSQFERELVEQARPSAEACEVFPLRMIL